MATASNRSPSRRDGARGLAPTAPWAPLVLRLMVGLTFLWAGAGKWFGHFDADSAQRAALVELGALPEAGEAAATIVDGQEAVGAPPSLQPERVRRVWGLALVIQKRARPSQEAVVGLDERTGANGSLDVPRPTPAIWPGFLGSPRLAASQAFSVMVVELLGGLLLVVGLWTRASGVALAGVMLGALWLDQMGPAIQSGNTLLGFLPDHDFFETRAWMPMMWQALLLASSVAIVFLGAGRVSLDGASRQDDDHDGL